MTTPTTAPMNAIELPAMPDFLATDLCASMQEWAEAEAGDAAEEVFALVVRRFGYELQRYAREAVIADRTANVRAALAGDPAEMEARKDAAYLERNQVVAALAKCFPSGVAHTAIEGWSEDWHSCVYIDLPTGQTSWHFHDSQAYLFAGLPTYTGKWDSHDTPEKYRRLAALAGGQDAVTRELLEALTDLRKQVNDFCVQYGEADFYTGDATKAIQKALAAPLAGGDAVPRAAEKPTETARVAAERVAEPPKTSAS